MNSLFAIVWFDALFKRSIRCQPLCNRDAFLLCFDRQHSKKAYSKHTLSTFYNKN